jgi:hypothetical protein
LTPLLLTLAALTGCGESAAPVARAALIPTGDTVVTPYGDITDAAWLAGERWVVIAPQDRAVAVADFAHRSLARFGGSRAKELAQPFHLFRSGDSVYVADWQRRRLTAWSLDGGLGDSVPALDAFRGALPRARDAAGRWYLELRPAPGRDGRGNLDSGLVVRAGPAFTGIDTVARLAPFDLAEVVSEGRSRLERRLLSGQDRWGVFPDGTLWVARVSDNRVEWRDTTGHVARGRELPDRVLPITQNDRDLFLNRFEPGLRPTVEAIPFAAIKPPFDAALGAPDGRVWLTKSRAVGDSLRSYQVIDARANLIREITHPSHGRILALGGGYALVGEPFGGGVRLLRFRLPADSGGARP